MEKRELVEMRTSQPPGSSLFQNLQPLQSEQLGSRFDPSTLLDQDLFWVPIRFKKQAR